VRREETGEFREASGKRANRAPNVQTRSKTSIRNKGDNRPKISCTLWDDSQRDPGVKVRASDIYQNCTMCHNIEFGKAQKIEIKPKNW
jgi:hypothetical protein